MPPLVYGTAWKEDQTAALVRAALGAGFRGIDTANQRRHYHEAGVGEAVREALANGLERNDLFLQTKFTFVDGQDHRLPYDPKAPVRRQVGQSLQSSLEHLGVDRVDGYLLHGPRFAVGLHADDWAAWGAMEDAYDDGTVTQLGVSNVNADQLQELLEDAEVPPELVQNRCFTRPQADLAVRTLCAQEGLQYQGFSLLTGHRLAATPDVAAIAARLGATPAQVVFAYCLARGMTVLTGTTSAAHMTEDLAAQDLAVRPEDLAAMDRVLGVG